MTRLSQAFEQARAQNRAALVTFITAGDPDPETSFAVLENLPQAGADILELGMPFSDPMADGPAIEAASHRALKAGMTLAGVLAMVRRFRAGNAHTPLILMGYYNPIYVYGVERFLADAQTAGVDGLIVVDLPPEEDAELCLPARAAGLDFIRLATPTTDAVRLPKVLANASGFVYYVSITGITGTASADSGKVGAAIAAIRAKTDLPIVAGFGIKTPADVASFAQVADGVVVGSAIVGEIAASLDIDGQAGAQTREKPLQLVRALAAALNKKEKAP